jgi:hypothetical protein
MGPGTVGVIVERQRWPEGMVMVVEGFDGWLATKMCGY